MLKPIVERWPTLAATYRLVRDNRPIRSEPRETALGFKFTGNEGMMRGEFEPVETELVNRILPHIDVFINIGANIGYYVCMALKHDKKIVAFEPIPRNIQYLLRNIRANNPDSSVEVYPLALSDSAGIVEIYGGATGASLVKGWSGASTQYVSLVPASTLDLMLNFRGEKCFILVDIEGAEKRMLEGAESLLDQTPRPIWMVEIMIKNHQPKGVSINPNLISTFKMFWDRGYEAWTATENSQLVEFEQLEEVVKTGVDPFNTSNYIFVERGKKGEYF